ncbi:delta-60 repeat domain-containing protein [Flavobacterium sp. ST-75]|uniref:Delta-60 repeat domain-containing protein n=1 Tax=Flavobacterium rhizophilum TaxID=3163296 RepID=A0ABW8YDK0_9FLAO
MYKILPALLLSSSLFSQSLTVDQSFSQNSYMSEGSKVLTITELSNHNFFIGGDFHSYNNTESNFMAVLNNDGSSFEDFSCSSCLNRSVTASVAYGNNVLIGGSFFSFNNTDSRFLVLIDQYGQLVESFSSSSIFDSSVIDAKINKIEVHNDMIYVCGAFFNSSASNTFYPFFRLLPNGNLDSSFTLDPSLSLKEIFSFTVQPDGKIILLTKGDGIVRINEDGSLDNSFSNTPFYIQQPHSVSLQDDGKILVGGRFVALDQSLHILLRLNSDGSSDESFDLVNMPYQEITPLVTSIIKVGNRHIIAGRFTSYNGYDDFICLDDNGFIIDDFNINGVNSHPYFIDEAVINSVLLTHDNMIMMGGDYGKVGEYLSRSISRLDSSELNISEFELNKKLHIYTQHETTYFNSANHSISSIEFYDISGRLIDSAIVNSDTYSCILPNNSLILYRIFLNDGAIVTGKVIR